MSYWDSRPPAAAMSLLFAVFLCNCATPPPLPVKKAAVEPPPPKMDVTILVAPRGTSTGSDSLFVYANVPPQAKKVEFCFQGKVVCAKKEALWMEAPRLSNAAPKTQTYGMPFKKSVLGSEGNRRRHVSVRTHAAKANQVQTDTFAIEYASGQWNGLAQK